MSNTILRPARRGLVPGPVLRPHPPSVRLPTAPVVRLVRDEPARPAGRNPESARGAVHPPSRRDRSDAVLDQHDDARRPRVLPVRPHRRSHPRGPGRLRSAAQDPPRRDTYPRPGPARADPVPPDRTDHHRAPRRAGLPARHQRTACLRSCSGANRGLPGDSAWAPRPPSGRQGHQARHHALTVPVLRVLEACRGERTEGPLILRSVSGKPIDRRDCYRMVARIAKAAGIPGISARTRCATRRSPTPSTPACHCATRRSPPATPTPAPPSITTAPAAASTATESTSSPPMSPAFETAPTPPTMG
jgi:hypothetical protein